MSSIYELSTDDDSGDGSMITDALDDIRDGSQMHPYIKPRDAR